MQNDNYLKELRFVVYLRKSTEGEDKQMQSIEGQELDLNKQIERHKLEVIKTYKEEKSAKKPGRKIFNEMLDEIELGKLNAISTWHINRLSRNALDSGRIQYLLQEGFIKAIVTNDKVYYPDDNALMLALEMANSNQFIRDLSKAVKRGIHQKAEKGDMPGKAPIGYKNTKSNIRGENKIIKDEAVFDIVRIAFKKFLSKNYTVEEVYKWLCNVDVKSPNSWKRGGKRLGRTTFYSMLTNPFYAGKFRYTGKIMQGNHHAMITWEEHLEILKILKGENVPKTISSKREFFYKGIMLCPECKCSITASKHNKKLSDGSISTYHSYHCTKGKNRDGYKCSNTVSISENDITKSFADDVNGLNISDDMHRLLLDISSEEIPSLDMGNKNRIAELEKNISLCESKIDRLTNLYLNEGLSEIEYKNKKEEILYNKNTEEALLEEARKGDYDVINTLRQIADFTKEAKALFESDRPEDRKSIIRLLGDGFVLNKGDIEYNKSIWHTPFRNLVKNEYNIEKTFGIELSLNNIVLSKNSDFSPSRCAVVERVRTIFENKNDATVYIPTFYPTTDFTI